MYVQGKYYAFSYPGYFETKMSKVLNFKVVLLGEVGVGKTSIFVRLRDNKFIGSKSTIGVDKGEFEFEVNGTPVKVTRALQTYHISNTDGSIYDKLEFGIQ